MVYMGKSVEKEMYFGDKPKILEYARELRKNPTEAESKLWRELQKLRDKGIIFRRHHPIDIFIADFYSHSIKLVIEVDGEIHEDNHSKEKDDGRSAILESYGIKVIRFKNDQILENPNQVLTHITNLISDLSSPSLPGEGDRRG